MQVSFRLCKNTDWERIKNGYNFESTGDCCSRRWKTVRRSSARKLMFFEHLRNIYAILRILQFNCTRNWRALKQNKIHFFLNFSLSRLCFNSLHCSNNLNFLFLYFQRLCLSSYTSSTDQYHKKVPYKYAIFLWIIVMTSDVVSATCWKFFSAVKVPVIRTVAAKCIHFRMLFFSFSFLSIFIREIYSSTLFICCDFRNLYVIST